SMAALASGRGRPQRLHEPSPKGNAPLPRLPLRTLAPPRRVFERQRAFGGEPDGSRWLDSDGFPGGHRRSGEGRWSSYPFAGGQRHVRLQIMSDLHFEMHADGGAGLIRGLDPTGVDVLVLAGDITMAGRPANLQSVFEPLAKKYRHILYVPGNHEYYRSSPTEVA